jgi:outer membrane protein
MNVTSKMKCNFKSAVAVFVLILLLGQICLAAETPETKSYSLEACLQLAYQNSEALKTATLKFEKAQYGVKQAESGCLPSLTYNLYDQQSDTASMEGNGAALTLSQNLYTGGKLQAGVNQAKLGLANAQENERQVKQKITYDVKAAFYQLWLATEKLKVAQAAYDNMEKHFRNVEKKYQEGAVSHFDLMQAEVNWKKLKPEVISAQNALVLSRLNLGVLIGVKSETAFAITADGLGRTTPEKTALTLNEGLETAYRDRPEMRQQQNSLESARLAVAIAKAGYYPAVTASGSYQATGQDWDWDHVWAVKVNLSGMIFDGNATKAKVAAAKVDVKTAESDETQLQDSIRLALESGLQSLEESTETIAVQQANTALMQNALQLTRLKLEEGLATTTDLMDAQLDLDQTLNDYYNGICNYLTARAKLDLILGKDI